MKSRAQLDLLIRLFGTGATVGDIAQAAAR